MVDVAPEMPRVLIVEPIYQGLTPAVYSSRAAFWTQCSADKLACRYSFNQAVQGPRKAIRTARDEGIRLAMALGATHILFLDDDIIVPADILNRLLAVDGDIVGGLMLRDDGTPLVFRDTEAPDGEGVQPAHCGYTEEVWVDHPRHDVFECAAVGAGCMLVKIDTFHRWMKAHELGFEFRYWFNYDETGRSMDVRFCYHARDAGMRVWCLPDPACTQIRHY